MSAPRALSTCDHCGQTDDHPKAHLMGAPESADTFHNDCLSARNRALVAGADPINAAVIEACEGGLRGDDLLAHIATLTGEK